MEVNDENSEPWEETTQATWDTVEREPPPPQAVPLLSTWLGEEELRHSLQPIASLARLLEWMTLRTVQLLPRPIWEIVFQYVGGWMGCEKQVLRMIRKLPIFLLSNEWSDTATVLFGLISQFRRALRHVHVKVRRRLTNRFNKEVIQTLDIGVQTHVNTNARQSRNPDICVLLDEALDEVSAKGFHVEDPTLLEHGAHRTIIPLFHDDAWRQSMFANDVDQRLVSMCSGLEGRQWVPVRRVALRVLLHLLRCYREADESDAQVVHGIHDRPDSVGPVTATFVMGDYLLSRLVHLQDEQYIELNLRDSTMRYVA